MLRFFLTILMFSFLAASQSTTAHAQSVNYGGASTNSVQGNMQKVQGTSQSAQGNTLPSTASSSVLLTQNASVKVDAAQTPVSSNAVDSGGFPFIYLLLALALGTGVAWFTIKKQAKTAPVAIEEKEQEEEPALPVKKVKKDKKTKAAAKKRTQNGRPKKHKK